MKCFRSGPLPVYPVAGQSRQGSFAKYAELGLRMVTGSIGSLQVALFHGAEAQGSGKSLYP
jgi:hypothetical protein